MPIEVPIHFNGNLPAAVDVETTGPYPGINDVHQIAIIPLTPDYKPHPTIPPIDLRIKPMRLSNMEHDSTKMSRINYIKAINEGVDASMAADLVIEWFKSLGLPEQKNLVPIGHNYTQFDRPFLIDWMGQASYDYVFSPHPRDVMQAALFVNDLVDWRADGVPPFARFKLGALCARLGVERLSAHNAISDALAAAECYRRILQTPR